MDIEQTANGTILVGVFRDQPELLGALQAMHDFGVELAEVRQRCTSVPRDAGGRDDIRTEVAGVIAGSWFAGAARRGEDLIAAGLLMLAGPVDLGELDRWVRVVWERRRGSSVPYANGKDQPT
ncbi:MAG TPA: hypothetical protein VJ820_19590 [Propionibacteriaceae bacterium]|nr:hypothetical protein [Propionibacteriaceae bacterium]